MTIIAVWVGRRRPSQVGNRTAGSTNWICLRISLKQIVLCTRTFLFQPPWFLSPISPTINLPPPRYASNPTSFRRCPVRQMPGLLYPWHLPDGDLVKLTRWTGLCLTGHPRKEIGLVSYPGGGRFIVGDIGARNHGWINKENMHATLVSSEKSSNRFNVLILIFYFHLGLTFPFRSKLLWF